MEESGIIKILILVGIISMVVIIYSTTVSNPVISKSLGKFIFYGICSKQDIITSHSADSCGDLGDITAVTELEICNGLEKKDACINIISELNRKLEFCSDINNFIERKEFQADRSKIKASCDVLVG